MSVQENSVPSEVASFASVAAAPNLGSRDDAIGRDGSLRGVYLWDADYPWDIRTEKICAALTNAGHDIHIVARNAARKPEVERLAEGTVHRMPPWRWLGSRLDKATGFPAFFSPRWRSHLQSVVRSVRPHVMIVRDLPLCPLAIAVGRRHDVPVILDMAENYAAMIREIWTARRQRPFDFVVRNPRFVEEIERYCLPRLDHVLTVVDESSERIIGDRLSPSRVSVVSNTPPRQRATESLARPRTSGDPLNVVYLGLMEIPRGVVDLLEAAARLKSLGRPIRLTLIGGGRDEAEFRERARQLGLEDSAEFHGYVPNKRALEMVAAADVGVVPHHADDSWNTTIPNKLFDYMASAIPVVGSDAVPCARIIRETGAGEVFRSADAVDLARAIERFFDSGARLACGEAGRRAVLERYNWEEDTRVLLDVVSNTARRGRKNS